ncbi:hypothetical protein [Kocuria sabuli]|uniref:hypothetical protein n=1 Tax=Kocuria sabuli TaxID=3071448 RepID=UPI0034D630A2
MPSLHGAPARRSTSSPATSRARLVVLVILMALIAAGVLYVISLTNATAPVDPWWRHLKSGERQVGRLEGIDEATPEVETPVFHNRTLRGN